MGRASGCMLLVLCFLAACARDATVRVAVEDLQGTYYSGDGLGRMVHVSLQPDGTFVSVWEGCLGLYGRAEGVWRLEGERLTFEPASESEMLVSYLSAATTVRHEGRLGFVREQDVSDDKVVEDLVFFRARSTR